MENGKNKQKPYRCPKCGGLGRKEFVEPYGYTNMYSCLLCGQRWDMPSEEKERR